MKRGHMTTAEKVLRYMEENKGKWFSGALLADDLSLSRNAVWKAVGVLRERGYDIESSPNKGYRLSNHSDKLSVEGILPYLSSGASSFDPDDIHVYESIDSTNKEALRLLSTGAGHGTIVASQMQTKGQGHDERSFISPPGGIYLSTILLPEKMKSSEPAHVTRAVADCICGAAKALCGRELSFEKPSGCLLQGKKVAGIFTEALYDLDIGRPLAYIPGIGINYYTKRAEFSSEIRDVAISIYGDDEPATVSRNEFIAELIKRLLLL